MEVGVPGAAEKKSRGVWKTPPTLADFPQRHEQQPPVADRGSPKVEIREMGSEFRRPKVGERRSAETGGGETDKARANEVGSEMPYTREVAGTPE